MTAILETGHRELLRTAIAACVAGRLPEGERLLRSFVDQVPESVDGWFNLGKVLRDLGRLDESARAYRRASTIEPGDPLVRYNLGNVLRDLQQSTEALQEYREAVRLDPHLHNALNNLGLVLEEGGDRRSAIVSYQQALREAPGFGPAHANLGLALLKEGVIDQAEKHCRLAVATAPGSAEPHYNLALVLLECDRYQEADEELSVALTLRNDFPEAWVNRAIGYQLTERTDEAINACRQAIALRPDFAEAHLDLAVTLLQRGEFEEGWKEYDWRFRTVDGKNPRRYSPIPEWSGQPLTGKTLLVYQEQGIGDLLQCLRFIPALARHSTRVVVACQPALHTLVRRISGVTGAISPGDAATGVDYVCPIFSLPRILGVTPDTIPACVPYLHADALAVNRWRSSIQRNGDELLVGVAWTGNPAHSNNRRRSLPFRNLVELLDAPGVTFHNLHCGGDTENLPVKLNNHEHLNDFDEVAGLMQSLDLVLTIDTSFAHLAGGLGVPVWLLLNYGGDWRWMLNRPDSPWYPTMKIFRQRTPGDWSGVVARVRSALHCELPGGSA